MKPLLLSVSLLLSSIPAAWGADVFAPGCTIPFDAIKTAGLDIDKQCGVNGGSDEAAKKAESAAKNNFCAPGKPKPITYSTFTKLEALSTDDIRRQVKQDRSILTNLTAGVGEGTRVQFVGFLLDAHVSNVKKGELVNCTKPGEDFNDIHIELVKSATEDDACNSVTAEMSPHLRPESWTDLPTLSIKRPVRVTDPLFFDGSHRPCHDDVRPSPNRISVWEIHPVYQFEVCKNKSLSGCKVSDESVWVPLDRWHSHGDDETEGNVLPGN